MLAARYIVDGVEYDEPCSRVSDPDIFFPVSENADTTSEAVKLCSGCRVKSDCLEGALARYEKSGVWGGLTTDERYALRRKRLRTDDRFVTVLDAVKEAEAAYTRKPTVEAERLLVRSKNKAYNMARRLRLQSEVVTS